MSPAQFLELLISLSLQAAIVVVLTSWACRLVQSPSLHCRLWNLCHVLLLALTAAALLLPHVRLVRPWQAVSIERVEQLATFEATAGRVAFWSWAIGAAFAATGLVWQWTKASRFLKTCRPASWTSTELEDALGHELSECAPRSRPRVLVSSEISSPFCCQWHQPYLVLPEFLENDPNDALRFVVRHELEHLRSGHPLHLFLQRVVETLFWFHPLVRRASRQMALAREFACDDAAVSSRRDVIAYLKMLLAIAERGQVRESEGALLFFGRSSSVVALRGRRLVELLEAGRPEVSRNGRLAAPAIVVAASVLCFLVWAPCDVLASARTMWSPWPAWSASVLRSFEIPARDFEPFERRTRLFELEEHKAPLSSTD
jgi:beta-lactamase regulating signal transducer with metallopeptidase domain